MSDEKEIRNTCFQYLKRIGLFVWRDKQVTAKPKSGIHFEESKGCPDIIGMTKDGKFLGVEIKKPAGVLTVHQYEFLNRIKANGGNSIVVTSVDDLILKMKEILK